MNMAPLKFGEVVFLLSIFLMPLSVAHFFYNNNWWELGKWPGANKKRYIALQIHDCKNKSAKKLMVGGGGEYLACLSEAVVPKVWVPHIPH